MTYSATGDVERLPGTCSPFPYVLETGLTIRRPVPSSFAGTSTLACDDLTTRSWAPVPPGLGFEPDL